MLDAKTILFSLVVAELTASAVLCFLFFFWKHRDKSGSISVGLWSAALLLGAVGTGLLSLRGVLPDTLTLLLANFLILVGTGIRRSGVAAFFHRRKHYWLAGAVGLGWLALCQIPEFRNTLGYRTSYNQTIAIVFILWSAFVCLWHNHEDLVTPKIYAFSAFLEAGAHVSVMLCLIYEPTNQMPRAFQGFVFPVTLLFILVSMVLSMFTSLSMPIERSLQQFKRKAYRDYLTGLPNRRAIYEQMAVLKSRGGVAESPIVIRFDIDDFKRINDTFGHAMGDEVLMLFGAVCRKLHLSNALAGRIGGDEFVIVCQGMNLRQAETLVEQIKCRFTDACKEMSDGVIQVSLSAGISLLPPGTGIEEALDLADQAAYEAKKRGGNNTVVKALPGAPSGGDKALFNIAPFSTRLA